MLDSFLATLLGLVGILGRQVPIPVPQTGLEPVESGWWVGQSDRARSTSSSPA